MGQALAIAGETAGVMVAGLALLDLTRLTPLAGIAAPAFTLSDQLGRTVFLGSLRGWIVVRYSRANHLEQLPNWHFLSGSTSALRRVWWACRIVVRRSRAGDLTHSDAMYLIDRRNLARWVAAPEYNKAAIPKWGGAIADIARHVARTSNRPAQAGAGVL
jgi:hypothetical protein